MALDSELMDSAWELYSASPHKGTKAAAKAAAKDSGIKWQEVNSYLANRIKSKKRKGWIASGIGLGAIGAIILSYALGAGPAQPASQNERPGIVKPQKKERLSVAELARMPGVERVVSHNSRHPDVIYILNSHPNWTKKRAWDARYMKSLKQACLAINNRVGLSPISLEGIGEERMTQFLEGKFDSLAKMDPDGRDYIAGLYDILNSGDWKVYFEPAGSSNDFIAEMAPVKKIHKEYEDRLREKLEKLMNEVTVWEGEAANLGKAEMARLSHMAGPAYTFLVTEYSKRLEEVLTPEKAERIYGLQFTERDKIFGKHCDMSRTNGMLPIIVLLGTSHKTTFTEELKRRGLSYAVVKIQYSDNAMTSSSPEITRKSYLQLADPSDILAKGAKLTESGWKIKK